MTDPTPSPVLEQGDPLQDPRAFRRCLGQFSTGVTVMTTQVDGRPVGVTANSFASVSMDPPLVLWSMSRKSRSYDAFATNRQFNVNILAADQIPLSQGFASKEIDKFAGVPWRAGTLGAPVLPGVLALLECEIEATHQGGDHVILIGRVRNYVRYAGNALLYAQGRYAIAEEHPGTLLQTNGGAPGTGAGGSLAFEQMRFTTALSLAGLALSSALDALRQTEGLDLPQGRVLSTLRDGTALTLDEIVDHSYLTRQAAGDAVASLAERGCVDHRNDRFTLTPSGQAIFAKLKERFGSFEAEQLAGIPKSSLAVAREVLRTLLGRLRPSH